MRGKNKSIGWEETTATKHNHDRKINLVCYSYSICNPRMILIFKAATDLIYQWVLQTLLYSTPSPIRVHSISTCWFSPVYLRIQRSSKKIKQSLMQFVYDRSPTTLCQGIFFLHNQVLKSHGLVHLLSLFPRYCVHAIT